MTFTSRMVTFLKRLEQSLEDLHPSHLNMETIRRVISLQCFHLAIGTAILDELARPEGGVDHDGVEETENIEEIEEDLVSRDRTVVAFAQFGNPIS